MRDRGEAEFGLYDPASEVSQSHRFLPHWFQPGAATFITFRTADSMPKAVIKRWRREQEEWLERNGLEKSVLQDLTRLSRLPTALQGEYRRLRNRAWLDSLDECHGACLLRRPALAQIVGDALLHFDGDRYDLDCFVVMPNHVHVLLQFHPPTTLRAQTDSWLRYTATRINERLNRRGRFWQSEPFDHLVRSAPQFEHLRRYIRDNPKKAGLRPGEYLYWTRVARLSES